MHGSPLLFWGSHRVERKRGIPTVYWGEGKEDEASCAKTRRMDTHGAEQGSIFKGMGAD
jgi:hypothetical protein